MIEAHGLNKCDVAGRGPVFEMLFGVALRIVNLGEPFAEVDPVAKVGGAAFS